MDKSQHQFILAS